MVYVAFLRSPIERLVRITLVLLAVGSGVGLSAAEPRKPNIVVIFIDDMGYADIGPFGATAYPTPNLDRMASEGMRMTDFVVSSAVCSASRAALMTGCYHERVSIRGAFGPRSRQGLNLSETTIAEVCKSQGYATACFGKWHLGDDPKFLPSAQGFDEYFGLPYSNDMWPEHPTNKSFPALPLIEGTKVIDAEVTGAEQKNLTRWYTEHAVDFIDRHAADPFFLYVPHSMVHVPLFVSDAFAGKSGAGLFGDVVMEVDWSVGQILEALRRHKLDDNTLVVFTSDNGPWLSYGNHAGSAGPFREGKGTMWEGGYREPTIVRWPGVVPAGQTCDELASTIDLLPTIASLIGAELPSLPIDGKNILPLLRGTPEARSPHEAFYAYYGGDLIAVRDRQFKLVFDHTYRSLEGHPGGKDGTPAAYKGVAAKQALYDLKRDPGETTDVSAEHPEVVRRLEAAGEAARRQLGDRLRKREGADVRPVGRV